MHSHAGGGETDLKPYKVVDTTGGQAFSSTTMTINLNSEEVSSSNYSLSNDEVTIVAAGTYLVSFTCGGGVKSTSGGTRGGTWVWIESDDGGSYSMVGALTDRDYHREVSGESSGLSGTHLLVHSNPNKKIRMRGKIQYSNTDVKTVAYHSGISILKVA